MDPYAHCRVSLREPMSETDSWDSVDAKNGLTLKDWTIDSRDIDERSTEVKWLQCHKIVNATVAEFFLGFLKKKCFLESGDQREHFLLKTFFDLSNFCAQEI